MIKQLLKKFWAYEPFWKSYCKIFPIVVVLSFIVFWFIHLTLESRGVIVNPTYEQLWQSLIK